jgi:aryl-alcohol dehydrogenase-like predicted oxidoreductase
LKRLGVDVIDVYRPARLDPNVPIEDTIGAIADLVKAGYVKHIGLSEVSAATVERAHKAHPISDLQIEYSLATRGPEETLFPTLHRLGISATLYGVFSRGLLTGAKVGGPSDFRAHLPRFAAENAASNARVVDAIADLARQRGKTPGQLAIGWVLAKEPAFVPVLGARTMQQLDDAIAAEPLAAGDVALIDALGGVKGERYQPEQMRGLDSERR